jgi:hypothetical protein
MDKPNVIKRYITGGRTAAELARDPAQLHISGYDGTMWASNRQWLTFAERVTPLLTQYNLTADPGSFEVNGTVRRTGDKGPDFRSQLDQALDLYDEPITPVKVGVFDALVQVGKHQWAAYRTEDGELMRLDPEVAGWLTRLGDLPVDEGCHYAGVRIMSKGHAGPVIIVADQVRTVKHAGYGTDPDTGKSVYIPAEVENLGPRVLGMMMALRLES